VSLFSFVMSLKTLQIYL